MCGAGSAALGGISSAINVFTFEDGTLERAGLLQSHQSQTVPPFLVVASNDVNQVGAPHQAHHNSIIPKCWAAQYITWLLIRLTLKGVVSFFTFVSLY